MERLRYLVLVLLMFIFMPTNVYATGNLRLSVDKTDLEIGDEIVVSVSLPSDTKAYALLATLTYDENVFERIDDTNFITNNNTIDITYNSYNKKFGIINQGGEITDQLFQVVLKVKEEATVGDTNIALTNISTSDGKSKTTYPSITKKVLVTRDAKDGEVLPEGEENKVIESDEVVIKAFTNMPFMVILVVLTIVLLGINIYIVIKHRDKKKVFWVLIIGTIGCLVAIMSLCVVNIQKRDINKDGIQDYDDAKEIIKYLIDMDVQEEDNLDSDGSSNNKLPNKQSNNKTNNKKPSNNFNYDVNNDGKVDVNDVGSITEDTTKHIKVLLEEINKEDYVKKGEISLNFKATIEPQDIKITKVKMNDKYYDVITSEGVYTIMLEVKDAGIFDFVITSVLLENGKEVETNYTFTREVLKDVPYISNFDILDNSLSFDLIDNDNAFKSGTVTIYDNDQVLAQTNVLKKTTIEAEFLEDKTYYIEIKGSYDLDNNKDDNKNSYDEIMFNHTFVVGGNYNFKLTDISITDALQEGELPVVSFISTNDKDASIINANLNGKDYNISKVDGNYYEVELIDADITPGKHVVSLDRVYVDTLKTFNNKEDYNASDLTYYVLKKVPKVTDIILNDKEDRSIDVTFKLVDEDKTFNSLAVVLLDSVGNIVDKKNLNEEDIKAGFVNLSYEKNTDGYYKVRFLADYELAYQYKYTNQNIGEKDILTNQDIYIEDIYISDSRGNKIDNLYPTKGQKNYQVTFSVHVGDSINAYAKSTYNNNRTYQRVTGITINGLNYVASQVSGYKSLITLTVPDLAGILDIKANRVQLAISEYYFKANDYYSVPEVTQRVDVLKDAPKIENLEAIKEDYEKQEVTFAFDVVLDKQASDNDESFKNGVIILNGDSKDIKRGHNEITFDKVNQDEDSLLVFKASYDLDTDTINEEKDKNEYGDQEIYKVNYGLYNDDYYQDIKITDGIAISKDNNKYFLKKEDVKLNFKIEGLNDKIVDKVIIDNKGYSLTKLDDSYQVIVDGYKTFGEKEILITDVILENGRKVTLDEAYKIELEVLKDKVSIEDFKYEDLGDKIKVSINIKDYDKAIVGKPLVKITTEDGRVILNDVLDKEISISKESNVLRYNVLVITDYDRDIHIENSDNYYNDQVILNEIISIDDNYIELRDINEISLYKSVDDKISLVDLIEVEELKKNKNSYFVEIKMDDLPSVRGRIKNVIEEDNKLVLVLDYEYLTRENTHKTRSIRIDMGTIKDGIVQNDMHQDKAFKALLEELNKGNNVTLQQNYDANSIDIDTDSYVTIEYKGILDGNGFTIKNLTKPLFNVINQGEVKDLILDNVTLDSTGRGALANETKGTKVSNIIVTNVTKGSVSSGQNGGLIGNANSNTTISGCGIKNVVLNGGGQQQNGGIVGYLENSTIDNSYAIGSVSGWHNFNGGFVGNAIGSVMTNNYVNVKVSGPIACDFACTYTTPSTYINNIALGSGGNNGFAISNKIKEANNNYYLTSNEVNISGINKISKDEVNKELFNKALFKEDIWLLDNVTIDNLPIFNYEKTSVLNDVSNPNYDESKELLYQNLKRLMPFYDSDKIIEIGRNINDPYLTTKEIVHIVPIDNTGNIVTYLTSDNPRRISKIKVVYKTLEKTTYDVTYDKTYDMVATYQINDLGIFYNYNHYVIDASSQVVSNLVNYLKTLDYTNNLDILTSNADSRIYRDYYNENTKNDLKEFILKVLANSNYTNTSNDLDINNYIEKEIKKDKKLEKALYTYNYFKRFYDLDIDGMKLYDFILFNMDGFDNDLNIFGITDLYFRDASGVNFNTSETNTRYANILGGYTNLNTIAKLLQYVVTEFSEEDMDSWVAKQFKGILVELPVEGQPEVQYTLWDHFSNEDKNYNNPYPVYNHILPILTLPDTAAYIISSPVQYVIGSQRGYMSNPSDPNELAKFKKKLDSYTVRIKDYFDTAYKILQDANLFNNIHTYHVDKRYTLNESGATVYNQPYVTEELFHKNFNEVVGQWAHSDGNAAVAWGSRIDWSAEGLMDGNLLPEEGTVYEYTFHTFTHETAHNIDARLFLRDYGRRFDAGGEDYADSNLMQSFGPGEIVMNLSRHFSPTDRVGSNYDPERIDTPDEIFDYYNKVFKVIYIMDYIEAQVFLQLDNEDKVDIAVQVSYPNEEKYINDVYARYRAYQTTRYQEVDASTYEKMNLKTIYDLYDNKIVINPGVYKLATRGSNLYGGESLYNTHWYQPHNPYGRPDSYSLKWIAYEMLGYAGYDKGYIEYNSNIHYEVNQIYQNVDAENKNIVNANYKTDVMALKTITNYDNFEDYKKDRFREVEKNLDHLNSIINVKEYVQAFYDALVEDAEYARKRVPELLKNNPNCLSEYWCTRDVASAKSYSKSSALRLDIYYKLKNITNDFRTDEIYMTSKQQNVDNLEVVKK